MKPQVIELNEVEQQLVKLMAERRQKANRSHGITDRKRGAQSGLEGDIEGAGGELAFCKLFNIYPDMNTASWATEDCITSHGWSVDVKTTTYLNGRLITPPWKKDKRLPDFYVLMVGKFPRYECRGFIHARDLLNDAHLTDLGHGATYAADQKELMMQLPRLISI